MSAREFLRNGNNPTFPDRAAAVAANVGTAVPSIRLKAYNSSVHATRGEARYRRAVDDAEYTAYPAAVKLTTANGLKFVIDEREVDLYMMGAVGGGANDTPAFGVLSALYRLGINTLIPKATFEGDFVLLANVENSGAKVSGVSLTKSVLKARAGSTNFFRVEGIFGVGNNTYSVFENFTIDMSAMTNASTSRGIYTLRTWGNSFRNVNIIGHQSGMRTVYLDNATYTTVFDNCDLGNSTGVVELKGVSLSDGVTTITFIGCSFAQMIAAYVVSVTLLQPVVQGALNKFVLSNVDGFNILGGDIEGSAGTYLVLGAEVYSLYSRGNTLSGLNASATYMTGTMITGALEDIRGGQPFIYSPNAGMEFRGTIKATKSTAGITRSLLENTNVAASQVDLQIKNSLGSVYVGVDTAGRATIDNRMPGKTAFTFSGTDMVLIDSNGDIETVSVGKGLILRSPAGGRYRLSVTNAGATLVTAL